MAMPTIRPAARMTIHSGREVAGAGVTTFCMGPGSSVAKLRILHAPGSQRARVIFRPPMTFSHGSAGGRQHAPLQLDDRATHLAETTADELDLPRRAGDAIKVVARQWLIQAMLRK